ncbi:MAG: DUF1800 domain-containing protein [Pirellulales bacterium]
MESAADYWKPYEPTAAAPWNRRRAVHLHRRAGFAATWAELERDLAGNPQDAVTRLIAGQARIDAVPGDFEALAKMLTDAATASQLDRRLKAAWVFRMLFSPDPLGERLTLLWHNHFATSNLKVQNLKFIDAQNDVLRRHGRAPFGELLAAAVHSPAMLVWLDADKNVSAHPNENLGRELMELFTLGIGNYTEADVQQAARALTGWKVVADQFRFRGERHDGGEKTILGQTAKFDGDGLLALLIEQPATARRVAWRLCRMMLGEPLIDDAAIDALAESLKKHDLNIGGAVEIVLRSERFFAAENIAATIAAPPQYVIGTVRALECFVPPPSTLLLAGWMTRMGQDLFYPPNVGGWSEGKAWLASGAIVARANFLTALVEGRLAQSGAARDFGPLIQRHCGEVNLAQSVEWLAELAFGGLPQSITHGVEREAASRGKDGASALSSAILLLFSRPEAHLA